MIEELISDLVEGSALDHEHVVHFLGVARVDATVYQVTEYVARGSLFNVIQHSKKDFKYVCVWGLGLGLGLECKQV